MTTRIDVLAFAALLLGEVGCSAPSETGGKDSMDSGDAWLPCSAEPYAYAAVGDGVVCGIHTDGCMDCGSWAPDDGKEFDTDLHHPGGWSNHGLASVPSGDFSSVAFSLGCAYRNVDMPDLCDPEYGACALGMGGVPVCWSQPYDEGSYVLPEVALTKVAPGFRHACGLREDGGIECWGECLNDSCAAPEGAYVDVASGHDFSCALDAAGTAVCWGQDPDAGQGYVDDADKVVWSELVAEWGESGPYLALYASTEVVCGVMESGTLRCKTYVGYGLDTPFDFDGAPVRSSTPVLDDDADWISGACGLDGSGHVVCTENAAYVYPIDVLADYTFTSLSSGPFRLCGLTTSGEIVCAVNYRDVAVCPFCTEILVDL